MNEHINQKQVLQGNKRRKALIYAACLLMLNIFMCISIPGGVFPVRHIYAGSGETQFEQINVLDDLKNSRIEGKPFSLLDYPYQENGKARIVAVIEYCYSYKVNAKGNYGLYLYVYNPAAIKFDTAALSNRVQMAVSYHADGTPDAYEKFNLIYCNQSEGEYKGLFYKFKVKDHISNVDGKTVAERVNSIERRYDISGIELTASGQANATDYKVGGTYVFTGYAAGYGPDIHADSTLSCDVRELETITLDLAGKKDGVDKRTYWRSDSSSKGKNYQNQINSVFFAIDNSVLATYDNKLQKIKAEWWEYRTRPAVVIADQAIFSALLPYKGQKIGVGHDSSIPYWLECVRFESINKFEKQCYWTWNASLLNSGIYHQTTDDAERLLPLLFYTRGASASDYTLSAAELEKYLTDYTSSYDRGHLQINNRDFSADLFSETVDPGRTIGHNERIFDADDPNDFYDVKSYDSTHNWWQKLWDYGYGGASMPDDFSGVMPIQPITPEDMAQSDLAKFLKINAGDVARFKNFYTTSTALQKTVFVFRYAQTDYFSAPLRIVDPAGQSEFEGRAQLRWGTQFFDFDIMEFTFNKEGAYHVIPVVSDPVDHLSDYTPSVNPNWGDGTNGLSWWQWLLMAIALAVLLILCWPLISLAIKGIAFLLRVITAPIRWLFGGKHKERK